MYIAIHISHTDLKGVICECLILVQSCGAPLEKDFIPMCIVDSELLLVVFEASLELVVKLIIVLQIFQPNLDLLSQLLNCWLFLKKNSSQLFIPKSAQFWLQIHIIINILKTLYVMLKNYF